MFAERGKMRGLLTATFTRGEQRSRAALLHLGCYTQVLLSSVFIVLLAIVLCWDWHLHVLT